MLLFYSLIELSPLKPSPGYVRYVLPIIPVLLLLIFCVPNDLKKGKWMTIGLTSLVVVGFGLSFHKSTKILNTIPNDTRYHVADYVEKNNLNAVYDNYAYLRKNENKHIILDERTLQELKDSEVDFLVISSFEFARYVNGQHLKQQNEAIYRKGKMYQELIDNKAIKTFTSEYSYSFLGPTIYLIDLKK